MPWTPEDAIRHNKKAVTPVLKRAWANAANSALKHYGDEGRAIAVANSAISKTIGSRVRTGKMSAKRAKFILRLAGSRRDK